MTQVMWLSFHFCMQELGAQWGYLHSVYMLQAFAEWAPLCRLFASDVSVKSGGGVFVCPQTPSKSGGWVLMMNKKTGLDHLLYTAARHFPSCFASCTITPSSFTAFGSAARSHMCAKSNKCPFLWILNYHTFQQPHFHISECGELYFILTACEL